MSNTTSESAVKQNGTQHLVGQLGKSDPVVARKPPFNLEAEQALLGALIISNGVYERVSDFLRPWHFYDALHGQIYETATKLLDAGKQVTAISLRTFFETAEPITPTLTVPQYLGTLAGRATTIINAVDYARTVVDLATRRSLILIGEDMVNLAYDSPIDAPPQAQLDAAEKALCALGEHGPIGNQEIEFAAAIEAALLRAQAAYQRKSGLIGLSTGLIDLDAKLGGLVDTDLIILAGRPGMGKTALATNIAASVALDGQPVHFFSQEMSAEQLAARVLAHKADVDSEKVRRGTFDEKQFRELIETAERIKAAPILIDQTGGLTLAQLQTRARRAKRKHGTVLIIVDYLQLLSGSKKENRVQDVTEITVGLKALAKELCVPIIALSQLNRAVELREDKRPKLSDLRESGSIEQDADVVMFVYREEYYLKQAEPDPGDIEKHMAWDVKKRAVEGKAEAIVGKSRHGPVGKVELTFSERLVAFANAARQGAPVAQERARR